MNFLKISHPYFDSKESWNFWTIWNFLSLTTVSLEKQDIFILLVSF